MPFDQPMPKFVSEEVPFVGIEGRRALTRSQMEDHPELAEMVRLFPLSFEPAPIGYDAVLFIEPAPPTVN